MTTASLIHASDCAMHNGPAYPAGECDCGAELPSKFTLTFERSEEGGWKLFMNEVPGYFLAGGSLRHWFHADMPKTLVSFRKMGSSDERG